MAHLISNRKIGGIRFVRIGQLSVSWCVTCKHAPFWDGPTRERAQLSAALGAFVGLVVAQFWGF